EEMKHLTEASYAQSEEVKKISSWAAILFAPTVVGGIYGMNFDFMPELHWKYGDVMAVGLMAAVSVALYAIFMRRGWMLGPAVPRCGERAGRTRSATLQVVDLRRVLGTGISCG